ncbi:MAG: hypothetical protein NT141_00380 [candidate division WWE3 bacterium]|nr:hypothetical protein [candidate division WWE3 bacterium]
MRILTSKKQVARFGDVGIVYLGSSSRSKATYQRVVIFFDNSVLRVRQIHCVLQNLGWAEVTVNDEPDFLILNTVSITVQIPISNHPKNSREMMTKLLTDLCEAVSRVVTEHPVWWSY